MTRAKVDTAKTLALAGQSRLKRPLLDTPTGTGSPKKSPARLDKLRSEVGSESTPRTAPKAAVLNSSSAPASPTVKKPKHPPRHVRQRSWPGADDTAELPAMPLVPGGTTATG